MSFPCHFVIVVVDVVDVLLFPCLFYIIPAFLASGFSISGFLFFSFFSFCPFLLYFSLFVFVWFVWLKSCSSITKAYVVFFPAYIGQL